MFGITEIIRGRKFLKHGVKTQAVIDAIDNQNGLYFFSLKYTTEQNEPICQKIPYGSNLNNCKEGDKITIYYNPDKPNSCTVFNKFKLSIFPYLVFLGGVILFTWGLIDLFNDISSTQIHN